MSYYFCGNTEDMVAGMGVDLDKAALGGPAADSYFNRALSRLVGLYDRQAEEGSEVPSSLELQTKDLCARLMNFVDLVETYTRMAILLAEDNDQRDWYELCIRRSVIQLLLDDLSCTDVAALIDPSDVAELDQWMRRTGLEHAVEPEKTAPKGLPESHWWWKLPDN